MAENEAFRYDIRAGIELQELEVNLYRAEKRNLWLPASNIGVFGGQVVAQALYAATQTVSPEYLVHSLHSHFILSTSLRDIIYKVTRLRDGQSFAVRTVRAIQDGKVIFFAAISFQKKQDSLLEHQFEKMPADQPPPESLPTFEEQNRALLQTDVLTENQRARLEARLKDAVPVDIRYTTTTRAAGVSNRQIAWSRAVIPSDTVSVTPAMQACIAAYLTDHSLGTTPLRSHPDLNVQMLVSLDHSIWFHAPITATNWHLYVMDSPKAEGGRALSFGKMFCRDGTLALTVAQETLIRARL